MFLRGSVFSILMRSKRSGLSIEHREQMILEQRDHCTDLYVYDTVFEWAFVAMKETLFYFNGVKPWPDKLSII